LDWLGIGQDWTAWLKLQKLQNSLKCV